MFTVLSVILYTAVVLIALLLIGLVLVQPSKGGGFGSAFGGVGESVFGAQAMGQLSKITVVLLTAFFVCTLLLAVITGHRVKNASTSGSVLLNKTEAAAPAAKEAAPALSAEKAPEPVKNLAAPAEKAAAPAKK